MNASANLAETSRAAASFRDPSGRLLSVPGRILRIVYPSGVKDLEAFLSSRTAQRMLSSGRLVQSHVLRSSELQPELRDLLGIQNQEWDHSLVLEHETMEETLELAWELSRHLVVLEWVTTEDPMFRLLCRGREDLYRHFTLERFEAACRIRFDILCEEHVQGHTRKMYLLRKKG